MIEVEHLGKSFGALVAVDDVSFTVRQGEIFGLLGPNGAGKTTSINMICGVLKPESGRVLIGGKDIWLEPKTVKQQLGVVPQEIAVYEDLSARDNLNFWASLYGLSGQSLRSRVNEALTLVGLSDRAGDKVKGFSGGMKRRLNLCMGLIHRPQVLLLDEPTVGIDPQARLNILDVVRQVAAAGTTVLYTTHYMDEAQELCDRIAIIDHGKVLTVGTLDELTRLAGEAEVLRLTGSFDDPTVRERLTALDGVRILKADENLALLSVDAEGPGLLAVLPAILGADLGVEDVSIQQPNLQSVFISLTGKELRD
jgi:ABC-2 type transport system ATP-binding protein